jgi:hypothetical protein
MTNDWKQRADKIRKERKEVWLQGEPFPIAADTSRWEVAVAEACECKTQLEAALVYAKYGIPVFPCLPAEVRRTGQDGKERVYKAKSPRPQIGIGGVYLGTIDPTLINKWWSKWPNDLIGGPMGRRVGVWTVDVDAPKFHGGDGLAEWEGLEAQYSAAPTRTHLTGTGGNHRMYQWDPARYVGCPVKVLPEGMEVKGDGGYIVLPPSPYIKEGKTLVYSVLVDDYPTMAPQWLMDMVLSQSGRRSFGGSKKKSSNGATKKDVAVIKWKWKPKFGSEKLEELCERVATAKEHHWDEAARAVYMFGRWCGGGAYDVEAACVKLREAAEKCCKDEECKAPDDYSDNIERALRNGFADPAGPFMESKGHHIEDFVAYLEQHKYIYRPIGTLWPGASVDNSMPCIDGSKAKLSHWLDQNQCVEQMTWVPGEDEFIRDKVVVEGGWKQQQNSCCYNLYIPPTIKLGKAGEVDNWLFHVYYLFSDTDADWIVRWLAHRRQRPGDKINHALVIGSDDQGIGKDAMLVPVREAVGPWNWRDVNPTQILGRFNGCYKSVVLRVNELRDLGDVNRYQFYDHMKQILATPPETLEIDEKYTNEYRIWNCVGVIYTTNYKTSGMYLPAEDRRHYVAWSDRKRTDFPDGYWNKLFRWYQAGGCEHVAAYLSQLDINGWDAKAPPPQTEAFWEIVNANKAAEDPELADIIDELGHPRALVLRHVSNRASPKLRDWLDDNKNKRHIGPRLKSCGYVPVKHPTRADGYWLVCKTRCVVYADGMLSVQERIRAAEELVKREEPPDELVQQRFKGV